MSHWKECKLGELVSLEYGKSLSGYQESNGKYPVYGTNGKIGNTDSFLSPIPSIIIGRKGAYRGVHFSNCPFYVIDTAFYIKPKTEYLDLLFLFNFLLTQDINEMDSGSAIPSTDRYEIYDLDILLPPLPEQRAIAGMLSNLDDKIDLLHRQNKTLEGMAETLFRKWFIEKADDSWQSGRLGDYLIAELGGTPSTSKPEYWNGNIPWINSGEVNKFRIIQATKYITDLGLKKSNTRLLPKGTTVIAITGATLGQISLLEIEACANNP